MVVATAGSRSVIFEVFVWDWAGKRSVGDGEVKQDLKRSGINKWREKTRDRKL